MQDRIQKIKIAIIFISPLICGFFMLNVGAININFQKILSEFYSYIFYGTALSAEGSILLDTRLPRILGAILIGASLSGCGAIMQNIFKNPLIDPFLLGISSGAALGCAMGIGIFPSINLSILAFCGAIFSSILILIIGKTTNNISLILAGVVISAFLSAITSLIQFFVPAEKSQSITIWLFGSLGLIEYSDVVLLFVGFVFSFSILFLLHSKINILSLQDSEAISLGVNISLIKTICMLLISFICALCVSISGTIGWIGLIVPHIARFLVGSNMKILLPCSLALGASMLLFSDGIARGVSTFDLPLGAINAIIFAPFFIVLLFRHLNVRY
ncbi:iron ABC transporter permease [Helicobacter sp. MIT 99-5507]|uniref:FecCD family ABC transporter permease n=1 Tax=Helicobacter sp. MIT 99-5507 TaxID=152489 RepID=UPI000E1E477D|nr:iron ABC transporter permease [Helicobacter sp. MIT 99-5507]RDU57631.1 iron ABC transporter permease [Helicobacter sp. MIT 99-5507]